MTICKAQMVKLILKRVQMKAKSLHNNENLVFKLLLQSRQENSIYMPKNVKIYVKTRNLS